MALVLADRVNETTTTAGTGTLTLAGAVSGYQSFSVIGNANTTYYTIVHQTANEWEVGIGTYTSAGTTLSRDTVLASSAGGTTKVTFSAGTKFVFCDYPAGKAIYQDASGNVGVGTSSPYTKLTVNGNQALIGGGAVSIPALSTALVSNEITSNSSAAGTSDYGFLRLSAGGGASVSYKTAIDLQGYGTTDNSQIRFYTAGTQRAVIDTSGNLGLGVTPSAWATYPALQVSKGSLWGPGSSFYLSANLYYDGTNRRYINSAYASEYEQASGQHIWFTAASGTAGAIVSLTQSMTLDASGNLGIGTSSPGTKLDVNGTVRIRAGNTLYFQNAAADANGTITASGGAGSSDLAINASGGNVGIGTSSPGAKLQVNGSGVNVAKLVDTSATGYSGLTLAGTGTQNYAIGMGGPSETAFSVANKFFLYDGLAGAMRMVVDSSGYVGIGTTSPSNPLTVSSDISAQVRINAISANINARLTLNASGTGLNVLGTTGAVPLAFLSGSTEQMRIDTSGNVGIGTSSPGNKLTVNGAASAVNLLQVTGTSGASQGILKAQAGSGATLGYNRSRLDLLSQAGTAGWSVYNYGDGGDLFAIAVYGGSDALNITQAGNVGIGTSSPSYKLDVNGAINLANGVYQRIGGVPVFATSGGYTYYYGNTNGIIWRNSADTVSQMSLDTSGNLGIGVTPSAWDTTASRALQLNGGSLWGYSTSQINLMQNAYYDAAGNFVYVNTAAASGYRQISGTHRWITAASGTAGTTATFTTSMLIDGNGFLGIGTTSPAYRLHVSNGGAEGVEINPTGGISSGAFLQCYNRSTSVYVPFTTYASEMYWAISGSEKMRLDTSGNLGIGTSSPGQKLTVQGGLNVTSSATLPVAQGSMLFSYESAVNRCYMGDGTGYSFAFSKRAASVTTDLMTLNDSGNLGLGVTPAAWNGNSMQIAGNIGFTVAGNFTANAYYNGTFKYTTSGSLASTYQQAAGIHTWSSAPSGTAGNTISFVEGMRLDASGNLLVGGTTQYGAAKITLTGAGGYLSLNTTTAGYTLLRGFDNGTERWSIGQIGFGGADGMAFYTGTANTERARIDSSGNLLVGTTTSAMTAGGVRLKNGGGNLGEIALANNSGVSDYVARFLWGSAPTLVGNITVSSTATAFNTSSDQRLKENITDADSASDLIDAIKVRQFDWKSDGSHQRYGMIAQELYEAAPEAVHVPADPEDMMSVDYSKLVPMLIKEIQSLRQRVAQLEVK